MTFDGQNIAAVTIVALAAAFVLRSAWRTLQAARGGGNPGCGGCGSCGGAAEQAKREAVTIEMPRGR